MTIYELKTRMELTYIENDPAENHEHFLELNSFPESLRGWNTWLSTRELLSRDPEDLTAEIFKGEFNVEALFTPYRGGGMDSIILEILEHYGNDTRETDTWTPNSPGYLEFKKDYLNFLNYPKG